MAPQFDTGGGDNHGVNGVFASSPAYLGALDPVFAEGNAQDS